MSSSSSSANNNNEEIKQISIWRDDDNKNEVDDIDQIIELPLEDDDDTVKGANSSGIGSLFFLNKYLKETELELLYKQYRENPKDKHHPIFVFGDNDEDKERNASKTGRKYFGGQASVCGKYDFGDIPLSFGITTTFHKRKELPSIHEYNKIQRMEWSILADKLRIGHDIIIIGPTQTDLCLNRLKFIDSITNKQLIWHNYGTGIADLAMNYRLLIQRNIDKLREMTPYNFVVSSYMEFINIYGKNRNNICYVTNVNWRPDMLYKDNDHNEINAIAQNIIHDDGIFGYPDDGDEIHDDCTYSHFDSYGVKENIGLFSLLYDNPEHKSFIEQAFEFRDREQRHWSVEDFIVAQKSLWLHHELKKETEEKIQKEKLEELTLFLNNKGMIYNPDAVKENSQHLNEIYNNMKEYQKITTDNVRHDDDVYIRRPEDKRHCKCKVFKPTYTALMKQSEISPETCSKRISASSIAEKYIQDIEYHFLNTIWQEIRHHVFNNPMAASTSSHPMLDEFYIDREISILSKEREHLLPDIQKMILKYCDPKKIYLELPSEENSKGSINFLFQDLICVESFLNRTKCMYCNKDLPFKINHIKRASGYYMTRSDHVHDSSCLIIANKNKRKRRTRRRESFLGSVISLSSSASKSVPMIEAPSSSVSTSEKPLKSEPTSEKPFKCKKCEKSYKNQRVLQMHFRDKHTAQKYKIYKCMFPHCGHVYQGKHAALLRHYKDTHVKSGEMTEAERQKLFHKPGPPSRKSVAMKNNKSKINDSSSAPQFDDDTTESEEKDDESTQSCTDKPIKYDEDDHNTDGSSSSSVILYIHIYTSNLCFLLYTFIYTIQINTK